MFNLCDILKLIIECFYKRAFPQANLVGDENTPVAAYTQRCAIYKAYPRTLSKQYLFVKAVICNSTSFSSSTI
jgi:hypothetical protein